MSGTSAQIHGANADPGFEVGRIYNRANDIHARFGGQGQGGISTPADYPAVFLFTGKSGEQFGYSDNWTPDGVFLFTGEGQKGEMSFERGNRAIRDHSQNGKSLYLFESQGKGKGYRFVGEFVCATWEHGIGPDVDGASRQTIVFHLVPETDVVDPQLSHDEPGIGIEELRRLAMEAASAAAKAASSLAKKTVYERSRAVRAYVLARANGTCESCERAAPFIRNDGSPYLEPHHTRRVSDGGPDDPRWVGAVCPNCHAEIHRGKNGNQKNVALEDKIAIIELRLGNLA